MPEKRRRLGRGLEALLGPTTTAEASASGDLRQVRVDAIVPNPYQPRQVFNKEAIAELASSMKSSGVLQPIVLRPAHEDTYQLIAGGAVGEQRNHWVGKALARLFGLSTIARCSRSHLSRIFNATLSPPSTRQPDTVA